MYSPLVYCTYSSSSSSPSILFWKINLAHVITESVHGLCDFHAWGWFCRQKLKPRPKSDLTLGIGLEVWQISWQVILLNLFRYSVTFISPISCRVSAVVGLDGSTRKPYLLNRCSLSIESRSITCSYSSNFWLQEFINPCWRIWCFRLCWIHLDFLLLGVSYPFTFSFPLISHSLGFWCSGYWWLALLVT